MKKNILFFTVLLFFLQIPCIKASCFACSTTTKESSVQNDFATSAEIQKVLDTMPKQNSQELHMLRYGALAVQKATEVSKEGRNNYIFSHTEHNARCSVRIRIPKKTNDSVLADISLTATQEHIPEAFKGISIKSTLNKKYIMSVATTANATTFWMSIRKEFFADPLAAQKTCAALKKTLTRNSTFMPSNSVKLQLIQEFAVMAKHFEPKPKTAQKQKESESEEEKEIEIAV